MKRLGFVVTMGLLAMAILSVGCTKATPAPSTVTDVTGILTDINTPAEPGPNTITVQTPAGQQSVPLDANTEYYLNGVACNLEDVLAVEASTNISYNCTIQTTEKDGAPVASAVYIATGK